MANIENKKSPVITKRVLYLLALNFILIIVLLGLIIYREFFWFTQYSF